MDPERHRRDFPVLSQPFPNGGLVYLDNACSSLKPVSVIDAVTRYYRETPVCGERSLHRLGAAVTLQVDSARSKLARFVGAATPSEVVFTRNATHAINLVAHALPWKKGDVVLTSDKEHNSNWVPWLELARTRGIRHVAVPSTPSGAFDLAAFERAVRAAGDRLRLVSLAHVSNVDGSSVPVDEVVPLTHEAGGLVLLDAAQSVPHRPVDAGALGVDFLAASLPKMLGPSGLGFLYGKRDALERLGPYELGGNTVKRSGTTDYVLEDVPHRFEAGLQNYAALAAVPAAVEYLEGVGRESIQSHESLLNRRASAALERVAGVRVEGPSADERAGILPFTLEGVDVNDVALYLDERRNVAVRSGAFCVHSYFERRGQAGWCRASFYLYNTEADVDAFVQSVEDLARSVRAAPVAAGRRGFVQKA